MPEMNRHTRRKNKKLGRSRKWLRKERTAYVNANAYHWHRRIINSMKGCERVEDLILSGRVDNWLKKGTN